MHEPKMVHAVVMQTQICMNQIWFLKNCSHEPNLVVKILMYIKRFYVSCKIMHSSGKTQICMNQNGLCKRFLKISSELIIVHTKVRIKYYARFWSARRCRHEDLDTHQQYSTNRIVVWFVAV